MALHQQVCTARRTRDGHDETSDAHAAGSCLAHGHRAPAAFSQDNFDDGPECGCHHEPVAWTNTTHDWFASVDRAHIAQVRARALDLAPGGLEHLILEVLAYAADEAEVEGGGTAVVTLHAGGASIADAGRGTDTRADDEGRFVKKPVMATRDLRFFDAQTPPTLPDGHARRGMSVVCALSSELVHVNRRLNGSWLQRYMAGVPVTDLLPIPDDGTTGTTVSFTLDPSLGLTATADLARLRDLAMPFATQGLTTAFT